MILAIALAAASLSDAQVVTKLHKVNQDEIQAGQLARKQCTTDYCKEYGDLLIADHTKADDQLKALSKRTGLSMTETLPQDEIAKMHVMHSKMDQVKKLKGEEFDKAFGQVMENGHADVISMLNQARDSARNPELKTWIGENIGVLHAHETRARALASNKSVNKIERQQKDAAGNSDRGTSGRTPATEMHKSGDPAKDNADKKDASKSNAEGDRYR